MGIYETTYILHPALQEGRLNDIIRTIEKKAESLGAEILFSDNWGSKKLAYLIDKEKYGTYIFFQYKISNLNNLKELNGEFEHNPNVLRYLNIKIEEEDIVQNNKKENVDTESVDNKKKDTNNKSDEDKENVGEKE